MGEINLLKDYPEAKRDLDQRGEQKSPEDQEIARQFGKEFFDGDRKHGYGGYTYNPRFWQPVIPEFQEYYGLMDGCQVLDVGCAKGFMLYDFMQLIPGIEVAGVDVSPYAIEQAQEEVKPFLKVGDAKALPFEDDSFDLVISINAIHNLPPDECKQALKEIMRVSRRDAFVTVDAYRTPEEKERMDKWNLTALTYMHVDEWKKFFEENDYTGDYYWFIP